jgi:CRP/FNR family cyclic AMP-dependent transcriptional regulator
MQIKPITALQRTPLFRCLTEKELADVAQRAVELRLHKGEVLFISGEQAKGLFVVVNGKIRVFQQNAEGREQVMHVDTAGSVIGEVAVFDDGPYAASAVSEMDAELLFIEKHDMHRFCVKYPALALRALRLMAARVRGHAQLVEALSFQDVEHRLASFFINEVKHAGSPVQGRVALHLLLSNQEIASRIGSVRDVVSRTIARMKHDGLIATNGRTLIILDLQALEAYAAGAKRGLAGLSDSPDCTNSSDHNT